MQILEVLKTTKEFEEESNNIDNTPIPTLLSIPGWLVFLSLLSFIKMENC